MAGAPPPRLSFDNTPPDIIALILHSLLAPPPMVGETRSVTYSRLTPDMPWFDFTRSRRGLYSMCLVSRRLSAMACPLLYRVVPLGDEREMLLFFRTLLGNPRVGQYTRYVACHITLTAPSVIQKVYDLFHPILGNVLTTIAHMLERIVLTPAPYHMLSMLLRLLSRLEKFDNMPEMLFCHVLMHLAKVETVLLRIPCGDNRQYTQLCTEIQTSRFEYTHTLLLQGDPDIPENSDPIEWGCRPHHYTPLFASFPNLVNLEVSSDLGPWYDTSLPSGIRRICLYNSGASPKDLGDLVLNAPKLEILYMTPNYMAGHTYDVDPGFSIALTNLTDLRNLNVSWTCLESERLTLLADMQSLRTLHIQMDVLYGTKLANFGTPLIDLLPPNLVELFVKEWRRTTRKPFSVNIFTQFACDVRKRLHDLQEVVLQCHTPWHKGLEREVKSMFLEQGVKFSVEA